MILCSLKGTDKSDIYKNVRSVLVMVSRYLDVKFFSHLDKFMSIQNFYFSSMNSFSSSFGGIKFVKLPPSPVESSKNFLVMIESTIYVYLEITPLSTK